MKKKTILSVFFCAQNSIEMTTAENLPQKKSDGTIIYPTITSLPPPEVLPHLHASDTIKGQLKVVNSETGQVETATQPAIVFVQKAKDAIQRHTLQNDIRYQVGLWFQEGKRAEFVKQLYLDAYEQMYRKKLSVLLIDASDQKTVVPEEKHVRVVKIKDFKKLQSIVGIATMQQVARLPSKLDNLWFPLILLHPHTREEKQDGSTKTNQWLNTCTYTSFVLIPYPNSLSGETWVSRSQCFIDRRIMNCLCVVCEKKRRKPGQLNKCNNFLCTIFCIVHQLRLRLIKNKRNSHL